MSAEGDVGHLYQHSDGDVLSPIQRIRRIEDELAVITPAFRGEEQKDGKTTPGVLRRLEKIETTIKMGGAGIGLLQLIQTFDLQGPIKHFIAGLFGGS